MNSTVERFSSLSVPVAARSRFWSDTVAQVFPGMSVDAGIDVRADLACWNLATVELAWARSSRARIHRQQGAQDERRLILHLQRHGRLALTQGTREAIVGPGAIVIADSGEPYRIDISDRNECMILSLPLDAFGEDATAIDWRAMVIDARQAGAVMLTRTIEALWEAHSLGHELDSSYQQALTIMLRAAVRKCDDKRGPTGRNDPVAFALDHLADPALSTSSIALDLGFSARGVQKAFLRAVGQTPTDFIVERRLAHAAERLKRGGSETVTEIAFALGFADSSQFCRRFRRHYGTTPSRWRQDAV